MTDTAPATGLCLICATEHDLTTTGRVPVLPEHVVADRVCLGSGAPPYTDYGDVDDLRRIAIGHAHTANLAARRHREEIAALVTSGAGGASIVERVTALVEAEVLASRWTSTSFERVLYPHLISAMQFLASDYVPTSTADAYMDARFRAATRTWLRQVRDNVPGSILGDLLRNI